MGKVKNVGILGILGKILLNSTRFTDIIILLNITHKMNVILESVYITFLTGSKEGTNNVDHDY